MSAQDDLINLGRKFLGISRMNAMTKRGFTLVGVSVVTDPCAWTFKRAADAKYVTVTDNVFPSVLASLDAQ